MRSLAVSTFLLALSCVAYGDVENVPTRSLDCVNVYWRPYGKIIPVDAVVGGHDENGKEVYVGRGALHNAWRYEVAPLSINSTAEVQVGALLRPVVAKNVEILCANPLSEVRWVKTSIRNIHNILTKEHPIVGGLDFNSSFNLDNKTYIGRIKYRGQLLVGKVATTNGHTAGLYFISNNRYHYVLNEDIEILVANL